LGLKKMGEMVRAATVPAVCLGGIDHSNVKSVLKAGAENICAVRCINASHFPLAELKKMLDVLSVSG
jgi:thiamine monophosphate synthase